MGLGSTGFQVLTEFRFDIGSALVNSEKLQQGVEKVSGAADQALLSFQALSAHLAAGFNVTQFGLLETMQKALGATDRFNSSTKDFAEVIASNMNYLTGDIGTMNDKLAVSADLMDTVVDNSRALGVSSSGLTAITKAAITSLVPKGLAGENFSGAMNLAGNAAVAGRGIGMGGSEIAGQLTGLLSDKPSGGLFDALVGSTSSFKGFREDAEKFTHLPMKERLALLNKGLVELHQVTGDTGDEITTLADATERFKDMIGGIGSILRPIGDAIMPVVLKIFKDFSSQLLVLGPRVSEQIGGILSDLTENPKRLIETMMQLRSLSGDFGLAKRIFEVFTALEIGLKVLKFAGIGRGFTFGSFFFDIFKKGLSASFGGIKMLLGGLFSAEGSGLSLNNLGATASVVMTAFRVLTFVLKDVLFPIAFMTTVFQIISRAIDIAKINSAEKFAALLPDILNYIHRMQIAFLNMISPVTIVIEVFADLLAKFFEFILMPLILMPTLAFLADAFEKLGVVMVDTLAIVNGFFEAFAVFIGNIQNGKILSAFEDTGKAFKGGFDDYVTKHLKQVDEGGNVTNHVTNIAKVEIKNDFKENIEPDRVAFTLTEQLLKVAQNSTQSKGQAFSGALAGGH